MGLLCFFHRNQTNCPFHSQDFYRNQFPLSSSMQHHQRIIINAHTSRQQSTGNAQNIGNAYQQQRRKITLGGETEHGFAVFFSQKPNKTETKQIVLFGFCEKNTANPISGKNRFGFAVYGFAVFGLWEKYRGCGFLWMSFLTKRLGRKRARRAPSV